MAFLSPYTVQIFLEEAVVMNFYVKANENSSYIFLFDIIVEKPVMTIYTKRINQHFPTQFDWVFYYAQRHEEEVFFFFPFLLTKIKTQAHITLTLYI